MPLADFRSKTVEDIRRMRPSRYEHTFASLAKVLPTNDDFFEMHFNQTFLNIYDYVERVFTTQLLGNQSPWLLPWSKESIEYAGEVATPGPNGLWDDWDYLMYSGTDRTYLLTGIIFKALDVHVFSSKLFGAAPKYLEFLDQQDRQYANLEGFRRTQIRADENAAYLATVSDVPPRFWDEVDRVATQIMSMLLPIYNDLGRKRNHVMEFGRAVQGMHNIVSYAGWLNVATRALPAIIQFKWPRPGEEYNFDQVNLHQGIFQYSSMRAAQADGQVSSPPARAARVRIVGSPEIWRYASQPSPGIGQTSARLLRPHVVYYQGYRDRARDRNAQMRLEQHVGRLVAQRKHDRRVFTLMFVFFLVAVLYIFNRRTVNRVVMGVQQFGRTVLPSLVETVWQGREA